MPIFQPAYQHMRLFLHSPVVTANATAMPVQITPGTPLARFKHGRLSAAGHRGKLILRAGSGLRLEFVAFAGVQPQSMASIQYGFLHDTQISAPMPSVRDAVIVRERTYRRHAALDGRPAGGRSTASWYAWVR